jgi:ADP-ribose pyrophosphatase
MIEAVSTREVYRNAWMTVREDIIRRPDGSAGVYGVVDKPDFAIVVPVSDGGFWLVEQFRYPVGRRAWEFPQGSWPAEKGGSQVDLARAELQEETGMRAADVRHLAHFYSAYGHSSQGCDLYLATELTPGPPEREITEQDMVHQWFSEEDFRRLIREGDIVDAATIAAYTYVVLDRDSR